MTVGGIKIEVIKKKIKNLHLYVLPPDGRVRVTAPKSVKDQVVKAFIVSKIDWIKKQQEKTREAPRAKEVDYVSGDVLNLWGISFYIEVRKSNSRSDVLIDGDRVYLHVREGSDRTQRETIINNWYREQMKYEIPTLLDKWQLVMGVNVSYWGIKNMKTRWGTCNFRDKRIWLNLQLAKKDIKFLEYVVVHELAHLIVNNHSKAFKDVLDKFLPNWRTVKGELNGKLS